MARVHSKHWDAKILFSDEQIQLVYHVEWFVFCTVYNFRNFPLGNEHKTKTNWHNASSSGSVSRLGHTYTLVKGYWYFKYNFSTAETIASYSLRLPTSKLIKTSTWSFWYPLPLACSHESLARSITFFCQNSLHCTCNNKIPAMGARFKNGLIFYNIKVKYTTNVTRNTRNTAWHLCPRCLRHHSDQVFRWISVLTTRFRKGSWAVMALEVQFDWHRQPPVPLPMVL